MLPADQPTWVRDHRRTIGRRLQDARRAAGLTQEQVGELLQVDRRSVQNWEAGRTDFSVGHLILVADAVGLSLPDLVR